jgi:hypothetical protein
MILKEPAKAGSLILHGVLTEETIFVEIQEIS